MELRLGRHSFDVTNRGLVVAVLSGHAVGDPSGAEAVLAQRPHVVDVVAADGTTAADVAAAVTEIARSFGGPVSIRADDAAVVDAALRAGASVAHDPNGLADSGFVAAVQAQGASLIVGVPVDAVDVADFVRGRASAAEAVGIDPAGIVFRMHRQPTPKIIAGRHWAVSVEDGPSGWGQAVRAIMGGARLVFTDSTDGNVRSIRRTVDTIAELLARRTADAGDSAAAVATSEPSTQ